MNLARFIRICASPAVARARARSVVACRIQAHCFALVRECTLAVGSVPPVSTALVE